MSSKAEDRKYFQQKISNSLFKLPRIQKYHRSNQSSQNNIIAQETPMIIQNKIKRNNSFSKQLVNYQHFKRYQKAKPKSRVDPTKMNTQSTNNQSKVMQSFQINDTLRDFQKNIQDNKRYLILQKNKRRNIEKLSKNSLKNIQLNQHQQIRQKSLSKKPGKKNEHSPLIFKTINKIISKSSQLNYQVDLDLVNKTLIQAEINKSIKKKSPQKSLRDLKKQIIDQFDINGKQRKQVKNQKNYCEWRRVILTQNNQELEYLESNFDTQNKRIKNLAIKNQAALSMYFKNKRLLMQLKSKVKKNSL